MEPEAVPPILSRLPEPAQRFLSRVLEHGFATGLRFPDEFLRRFGAKELMLSLAEQPTRRARILEATAGLRPRIALRKSPESAAEDLQLALEEGETDAATILKLLEPDDRVLFLNNQRLWGFVIEPRFWSDPEGLGDRLALVREHTTFVLECALEEGLLGAAELVNAVSVSTLVEFLPTERVAAVLERALVEGRSGSPFDDKKFLEAVSIEVLLDHIPLAKIWDSTINGKVAAGAGWIADSDLLFDEAEAHPDASGEPPVETFPEEPKTAEL